MLSVCMRLVVYEGGRLQDMATEIEGYNAKNVTKETEVGKQKTYQESSTDVFWLPQPTEIR